MVRPQLQEDTLSDRSDPDSEPVTEYDSKMVMLRAERNDRIDIQKTVNQIEPTEAIPTSLTVARRTNTYYGPKIELRDANTEYLLTAPGPDAHLLLWKENRHTDGFRVGWRKIAEVKASFDDQQPQYDLCPYCGEPLKTLEHERESAVGKCPRAD